MYIYFKFKKPKNIFVFEYTNNYNIQQQDKNVYIFYLFETRCVYTDNILNLNRLTKDVPVYTVGFKAFHISLDCCLATASPEQSRQFACHMPMPRKPRICVYAAFKEMLCGLSYHT